MIKFHNNATICILFFFTINSVAGVKRKLEHFQEQQNEQSEEEASFEKKQKKIKSKLQYFFNALSQVINDRNIKNIKKITQDCSKKELIKLLVMKNSCGKTLFHQAASIWNSKIIEELLKTCPDEAKADTLMICDNQGKTALHWSTLCCNSRMFELLLKGCPREKLYDLMLIEDEDGKTFLSYITWKKLEDAKVIELALDSCSQENFYNFVSIQDKKAKTIFHHVTYRGNRKAVKTILDRCKEDSKCYELISKREAGDYSGARDRTALHFAVMSGKKEIVYDILNTCPPNNIFAYICMTDYYGNDLDFLNITVKDPCEKTAFEWSIDRGDEEISKKILSFCPKSLVSLFMSIQGHDDFSLIRTCVLKRKKIMTELLNIYESTFLNIGKNKQVQIYRNIAKDVFLDLKKDCKYCDEIKQAMCNIVAYCIYKKNHIERPEQISTHKKMLDMQIKGLIEGNTNIKVPKLIKDFYAVFTNKTISNIDYKNDESYSKYFAMTPQQLKQDIDFTEARIKIWPNKLTKDQKVYHKRLLSAQKNNSFNDVEVFLSNL